MSSDAHRPAETMVWIDPSFETPKIPEHERYEGTELDANIAKGKRNNFPQRSETPRLTDRSPCSLHAALPEDETIKWVSAYGGSSWAISRKVDVVLPSGREKSYFAKVYHAPRALDIARGEFESTRRLREAIPHNVPLPVGYGLCADDASRSFFVAEFRDMRDELPGTTDLVEVVAKIHQKASPSGKFGYPCTTFQGKHAVDNAWCDSWEEWFTRATRDTMAAELAVHGPDGELEELSGEVLSKVIPRLIRPLETGGQSIKPVLVHGDLWHGNISIDNETKRPVLYDPCCFYGHYACESNGIGNPVSCKC